MSELDELRRLAVATVHEAGARIGQLRASRTVTETMKEGGHELVTSADLLSNDIIRSALERETPDAQILSEEDQQGNIEWARPVWVVDPIDGTVNYAYGHSHVGISLAYVVGGEVLVGVVHAPFQQETFVGLRGAGATLNGEALRPARRRGSLGEAVIATGFPHDHANLDRMLQRLGRVLRHCRDIRRLASPTLDICWVAAGRLDAAFETLHPWDVAAAGLVAREMSVEHRHYLEPDDAVPAEVRGEHVLFAHAALARELEALLRDGE